MEINIKRRGFECDHLHAISATMRLSRTLWVRIMLAPRCIANISHARELGSRFFGFGDPRKPPRKDLRETDTVTGMLPRFFNPPSTNRSLLICFELVFVKNGDFEACRKKPIAGSIVIWLLRAPALSAIFTLRSSNDAVSASRPFPWCAEPPYAHSTNDGLVS